MASISLLRVVSTRQCLLRTSQASVVRVRAPVPMQAKARQFSSVGGVRYARVGSQDRESIDTEATEYTKSGTDDSAAHTDEAFDPKKTDPGQEKKGNEKDGRNDLDVSPANPEVSKPRSPTEGGAEGSGKE